MNVQELREALADLPDHWPVHVAVKADGSGGDADTDYLYTLDVQRDNFPTQGNMAVIRIDYRAGEASEEQVAWLRTQRKYPARTPGVMAVDDAQEAAYQRGKRAGYSEGFLAGKDGVALPLKDQK